MGGIAAGVGIAVTAVSGIVSAYGDYQSGQAKAANSKYQAQVAANNATIANNNATAATQAGEAQAQVASMKGAAQTAGIRAAEAANGVDVNSGSALNVQASQNEENQVNTATTMANAQLQAYGYRSQAANYEAQSQLDTSEAGQESGAANFALTTGLLGVAGSTASKSADEFGGSS